MRRLLLTSAISVLLVSCASGPAENKRVNYENSPETQEDVATQQTEETPKESASLEAKPNEEMETERSQKSISEPEVKEQMVHQAPDQSKIDSIKAAKKAKKKR